jgi:hypothetical protein
MLSMLPEIIATGIRRVLVKGKGGTLLTGHQAVEHNRSNGGSVGGENIAHDDSAGRSDRHALSCNMLINDARGLAHLAHTGFFKPVHVKSLPAHARPSLIIARKKLVGQRVSLENQIHGLAMVFGVRLPRVLTAAFIRQALRASEGVPGLSAPMRGLIAARTAVLAAVAAIDADVGCS